MNETTNPVLQTDAISDATIAAEEADVLRKADAWKVKGFSVADAVRAQTTFSARVAQLEEAEVHARARAAADGIPYLDIKRHRPEASALAVVPADVARVHRLVPIRKVDNKLWVAMENPHDIAAVDAVRMASRCQVIPLATGPEGVISDTLFYAYPPIDTPEPPASAPENRASENVAAELVALVRDLQNEVRELRQEVQGLKKQVAAQQLAPPPALDARPAAYPAPRVFRATPAVQPPFPLFRD